MFDEAAALGRPRGPSGLVHTWVSVVVRPDRFFATGIVPGRQAPGIVFLAIVVLVEESLRIALVDGAVPVVGGEPLLSALIWLLVVVVLVAPAGVHLTAALQTVLLMGVVDDRAGVSETVQVLCYATAPCVIAGVPDDRLRLLCVSYGVALYILGIAIVHGTGPLTAIVLGALPATVVFGIGFRGIAALRALVTAVLRTPFGLG